MTARRTTRGRRERRGLRSPIRCSRSGKSRPRRPRAARRRGFRTATNWRSRGIRSGSGNWSGQPDPACLPLTTSMSTLRRPYSVTFASCARASGAARRPATNDGDKLRSGGQGFSPLAHDIAVEARARPRSGACVRARRKNGRPKAPVWSCSSGRSRMRHSFRLEVVAHAHHEAARLAAGRHGCYELMLNV